MTVTEKLNGYGPLAGIKVVEMCTYVAAPATVRVLSEMGAEVLKIESFDGDIQRTQGPGFGCDLTDTEDPTIDLNNTNKNWISLNLKSEDGLATACPFCLSMLEDGLASQDDALPVRDIAELLSDALALSR